MCQLGWFASIGITAAIDGRIELRRRRQSPTERTDTEDHSLSAQWEHTLPVTAEGEALTLCGDARRPASATRSATSDGSQ